MATRAYCVVSDGTNIYLPIKAEYYPSPNGRSRTRAYLGLLPNFFGGNTEGEDINAALCREVQQESQEKIILNNISVRPENALISAEIYGSTYYFWLVDAGADSVINFPAGVSVMTLSDDARSYRRESREMTSIIKIPVARLREMASGITAETGDEAIIEQFLRECGTRCGDENVFISRLRDSAASEYESIKKLSEDWNGSETKAAFVKIVRSYAPQS